MPPPIPYSVQYLALVLSETFQEGGEAEGQVRAHLSRTLPHLALLSSA